MSETMIQPLLGKTVLVVDDTSDIRTFLRISLQALGATCYEAPNATEGLSTATSVKPDLVVLDLGLPDRDGLDLLPDLKQAEDAPNVIILSVRKDQDSKARAYAHGASAYITKPFVMDDLLVALEAAATRRAAE
jgi:DNA-binding response OmpR family regulator